MLTIDLADGSETTIFPPATSAPGGLRLGSDLFADRHGLLSISPDRQRLIATFDSKALEIEIATGKVLTEFTNVHDLTLLGDLAGDAPVVQLRATPGPRYVLDP